MKWLPVYGKLSGIMLYLRSAGPDSGTSLWVCATQLGLDILCWRLPAAHFLWFDEVIATCPWETGMLHKSTQQIWSQSFSDTHTQHLGDVSVQGAEIPTVEAKHPFFTLEESYEHKAIDVDLAICGSWPSNFKFCPQRSVLLKAALWELQTTSEVLLMLQLLTPLAKRKQSTTWLLVKLYKQRQT